MVKIVNLFRKSIRFFRVIILSLCLIGNSTIIYASDAFVSSNRESIPSLKIAIVHSYHSGFAWSDDVERGFLRKLEKQKKVEVVYKSFLNAKLDPIGVVANADIVSQKLKNIEFDLLFVTDDEAFELIAKKYFTSQKQIVFAGLNRPLEEFGRSEVEINQTAPVNLSGVMEKYDFLPLINTIHDILPKKNSLIVLVDKSKGGDGVYKNFLSEVGAKRVFGGLKIKKILRTNKFNLWKKTITSAGSDDVIILLPFMAVENPVTHKPFPTPGIANWILKNNRVPEFANVSLSLGIPFFATGGLNGIEHGEDAAVAFLMSLDPLKRQNRISTKRSARILFNLDRAKKLGVVIPFELRAYSEALSKAEKK